MNSARLVVQNGTYAVSLEADGDFSAGARSYSSTGATKKPNGSITPSRREDKVGEEYAQADDEEEIEGSLQ